MKKRILILIAALVTLAMLSLTASAITPVNGTNGGIIVFDGTNREGTVWGDGDITVETVEGKSGLVRDFKGTGDAVWCIYYDDPLDFTPYKDNGYLEFKLYASDAEVVIDGQWEFNSNTDYSCDNHEINWDGFGTTRALTSGWNTIRLNFSEAGTAGDPIDFANVHQIRLYLHVYGDTKLALADCYVTNDTIGTPVVSGGNEGGNEGGEEGGNEGGNTTPANPTTSDLSIAVSAVALAAAAVIISKKRKH